MKENENIETEKVELQSEEFNDIVSMVPKWYERWGIIIIVTFMLLIFAASWFFHYPDIIIARVDITVDNPPASLVAKVTGKIDKIFVKDNEKVNESSIVAIIENTADWDEVLEMKAYILKLSKDPLNDQYTKRNFTQLGDLQVPYSLYLKQYQDYKSFVLMGYHDKKTETIKVEIKQQQKYLHKLNNRSMNTKEQLDLAKNQFLRDSMLFKQQVISLSDFEKSQSLFLQSKNAFETINADLLNTEIQITRLQQIILDLQSQKLEQISRQQNILKESFDVLSANISEWEQLYVLKAPIHGKVTFTRFWSNNQNIKTGDVVFTIVPVNANNFIAKMRLPVQCSGKVKTGNKVIIKLDDYPYMEYGFISACINKISQIPLNDFYYAEVSLPQKLITSYGIDISAKKELKGRGEIIVQDQRLLYKFMLPFRAALNRNKI